MGFEKIFFMVDAWKIAKEQRFNRSNFKDYVRCVSEESSSEINVVFRQAAMAHITHLMNPNI